MSPKCLLLVTVVASTLHLSSSPPAVRFAALGAQADNVVDAVGGFKAELLRPIGGIIDAKAGLLR